MALSFDGVALQPTTSNNAHINLFILLYVICLNLRLNLFGCFLLDTLHCYGKAVNICALLQLVGVLNNGIGALQLADTLLVGRDFILHLANFGKQLLGVALIDNLEAKLLLLGG